MAERRPQPEDPASTHDPSGQRQQHRGIDTSGKGDAQTFDASQRSCERGFGAGDRPGQGSASRNARRNHDDLTVTGGCFTDDADSAIGRRDLVLWPAKAPFCCGEIVIGGACNRPSLNAKLSTGLEMR